MELSIKDLITNKISGEWGEPANLEEGVKVIRTTNFTNIGFIDYDNVVRRNIDSNKIAQKKLLKGDIIIEKSGGSPNQPVGRVVFFDLDTDEDYLCNNFTTILRPDNSKVHPKYLFYQLFIGHTRGRTLKYQNKTTGIINLKLDNYLNEKINIPQRSDQVRISTILDLSEFLVTQRKMCFDLLDDFLKSTFIQMFGNPIANEKNWDKVPLKRFGKIITGNTPPRSDSDNFADKFIEWIKTDNIAAENLFVSQSSEYLSEKGLEKSRFVEKGALLVACIAGSIESVGRACLTDRTVSFNQQINAIQPNIEIDPFFLYWLFKISKKYIQNHATKGMKKILTKGEFEKILMIKPPVKLQRDFASIVEKTEILRKGYSESLMQSENLYNSLSQKVFKDDLSFKQFDTDETLEYEYSDSIGREEEYFPASESKPPVSDESIKSTKTIITETDKTLPPRLRWDKVSIQQIAQWIKEKYSGYYFSNEMIIRFLVDEHITFPDYYSSEELKKYPQLNNSDDLKSFVFSAINKENPFIKLEQHFYNGETENFTLKVTDEDYELIELRQAKERSGIYFSIIEE